MSLDASSLDATAASALIRDQWRDDLLPQLIDYVAIPALSPSFDASWEASGHIEAAVDHVLAWIHSRPIAGMAVDVQRLAGRTPLIVVEIDAYGSANREGDREDGGAGAPTVVLYGHIDKQPEMEGWAPHLGPWTPVVEHGRLYGRGGADDGYAAFASLTAIEAVQAAGGAHSRCLVLIEASEESGSPDLPAHVDALKDRLGAVDLVLCLDSGCATYDTMWLTTSLRGMVAGTLSCSIVEEGLHSGAVGGVVPSTFRIVRQLLDRVEAASTGDVLLASVEVEIPSGRIAEAEAVASELGDLALESPPFVPGAHRAVVDVADALIAKTWKASMSVTGADGLPPTSRAGNVLRPSTSLRLSLRVPPTADSDRVVAELTEALESDPPYGAKVSFDHIESADGWNSPPLESWLSDAIEAASVASFGRPHQLYGEGGTIPFMGMLGGLFPDAQFVITGVLGPESNAHGPNEFLDLAYAEKLTNALAAIIDAHARR